MSPRCPKCGCDVDHLVAYGEGRTRYRATLDDEGSLDLIYDVAFHEEHVDDYRCPECKVTLFSNGEEAEKFLRVKVDG